LNERYSFEIKKEENQGKKSRATEIVLPIIVEIDKVSLSIKK
jgi:hypothetical protein